MVHAMENIQTRFESPALPKAGPSEFDDTGHVKDAVTVARLRELVQ